MEENKYHCVWWDCFVCSKEICPGKCKHYVDELSENGKELYDSIQKRFDAACESVRNEIRYFDLNNEVD